MLKLMAQESYKNTKKTDLEGLEKGATDVKKIMKNQPFVSDEPL